MANETYTLKKADSLLITGFDHLQHQKVLGFLILLTYMLILLGNSVDMCIILTDRHLHKPMYIFICNLAIIDIMYSTTSCTTMISVLLAEVKTVSYYSCISRAFLYNLGDVTVSMGLTLMAIDRLIAIRFPLRYHSIVTNSRVILLIIITWLVGFAVIAVLISVADSLPHCQVQPIIKYVYCDYPSLIRAACVNPQPYFVLPVMITLFIILGLFPFILCTYAVLAYSVSKLSNNTNKKQMINTCLSHLIVLFSYFIPKSITILLTQVGVVLTVTERNALSIVASLVSPLINPTVYSIRTKEIRKRIASVFLHQKVAPNF